MKNRRKNRVYYNTEETVDRETGEPIQIENTGTSRGTMPDDTTEGNADSSVKLSEGVEEKKGSPIVGLMILIFMLVMILAIIYFWYWVFKNIFLILRGK